MSTVTLTIETDTVDAALACLAACANDRREPTRYRQMYAHAEVDLRAASQRATSRGRRWPWSRRIGPEST